MNADTVPAHTYKHESTTLKFHLDVRRKRTVSPASAAAC